MEENVSSSDIQHNSPTTSQLIPLDDNISAPPDNMTVYASDVTEESLGMHSLGYIYSFAGERWMLLAYLLFCTMFVVVANGFVIVIIRHFPRFNTPHYDVLMAYR